MDNLVKGIAMLFCKSDNYIILLFMIINFGLFVWTKREIGKANNMFNPRNDKVNGVSASMEWDNKQISDLKKKRGKMIRGYTLYANITAVFPLLGILGTVAALVTYSAETMMDNFMVALGTTLLGVFFAIICKCADSFLSAPLDEFVENADHVIQEYDLEKRHKNEA